MKRNIWGASIALLVGCGVAAYAQSGSSATGAAQQAGHTMTVVGCLQQADQVPSGTTSPAGTTGSTPTRSARAGGSNFVLTSAHAAPAGATATATTGTTGTSGSNPVKSTYFLDASQDLAANIGHEVEVTGTVDREVNTRKNGNVEDSSRTSGTSGRSATGNPQTEGASTMSSVGATGAKSMSTWEHLRVTAIRSVASSCSSK